MGEDEWVLQTFGLDMRAGANGDGLEAAQDDWSAKRADVIKSLQALEQAIRAMKDPLSDPAIILVKSIPANLTAKPSTKQDVDELRRYLETDSVIDDAETPNGFGIPIQIKQPLLVSLSGLERALPK